MEVHKIPFEKTGFFSRLFLDYVNKNNSLENFYGLYPSQENFLKQAKELKFSSEKRSVLHQALKNQYQRIKISSSVEKNLQSLLNNNTVTITTGHQLNIFTGPLYFVLKILTVIKTCEHLNRLQQGIRYVPVYWMASEDHDKEEINHFYLFSKKYSWETDQKGPVGKFSTAGFEKIFPEIKDKLPLFEKAYLEHDNLSDATRFLVNELFGSYGLIIIDGDDPLLKGQCKDIFKEELLNNISYQAVSETTEALTKAGYSGQVYSREINLFYMEKGLRERIIRDGESYKINNTDLTFSQSEILNLVEKKVERISPNVVLRPLYQESILPNVAYCGGPAEIGYWLQLKSVFEKFSLEFPILLPRNFSLIIQKNNYSKINKLQLQLEELFEDDQKLKEKIMSSGSAINYPLDEELKDVDIVFESIKQKAVDIDPTLEGFVLAEGQKIKKLIEQIEKRLKKAEEQKHEVMLSQLSNIKSKLFPEGQLQERRDNILNFILSHPDFIKEVYQDLDPFDYRLNIFVENE